MDVMIEFIRPRQMPLPAVLRHGRGRMVLESDVWRQAQSSPRLPELESFSGFKARFLQKASVEPRCSGSEVAGAEHPKASLADGSAPFLRPLHHASCNCRIVTTILGFNSPASRP